MTYCASRTLMIRLRESVIRGMSGTVGILFGSNVTTLVQRATVLLSSFIYCLHARPRLRCQRDILRSDNQSMAHTAFMLPPHSAS